MSSRLTRRVGESSVLSPLAGALTMLSRTLVWSHRGRGARGLENDGETRTPGESEELFDVIDIVATDHTGELHVGANAASRERAVDGLLPCARAANGVVAFRGTVETDLELG